MTRILALVTEAYGASGGIAQYNRDFLCAVAAAGDRPSIEVLPRYADGHGGAQAPGVVQRKARPGKLAYAFGALVFALKYRPDLVFCGHLYTAPLAGFVARLCGARLWVQIHGIEIWRRPSPSMLKVLNGSDLVLCVSRDTRNRLLAWTDFAPERAVVVPNTVGEQFSTGDRAAARSAFALGAQKALLSVSRLDSRESYKGHDRVIAALPGLVARGLDVVYLVAGQGDDQARLEGLAREVGVSERVRFLGHVPVAALPDLYRAADVFVLPSTGEGFGIVFLEAMACGTPVAGLAAGGARDALGDYALDAGIDTPGLERALFGLLEAGPDGAVLSRDIRSRFGGDVFRARVAGLWARLAAQ